MSEDVWPVVHSSMQRKFFWSNSGGSWQYRKSDFASGVSRVDQPPKQMHPDQWRVHRINSKKNSCRLDFYSHDSMMRLSRRSTLYDAFISISLPNHRIGLCQKSFTTEFRISSSLQRRALQCHRFNRVHLFVWDWTNHSKLWDEVLYEGIGRAVWSCDSRWYQTLLWLYFLLCSENESLCRVCLFLDDLGRAAYLDQV
jgi:hypothetical protein